MPSLHIYAGDVFRGVISPEAWHLLVAAPLLAPLPQSETYSSSGAGAANTSQDKQRAALLVFRLEGMGKGDDGCYECCRCSVCFVSARCEWEEH